MIEWLRRCRIFYGFSRIFSPLLVGVEQSDLFQKTLSINGVQSNLLLINQQRHDEVVNMIGKEGNQITDAILEFMQKRNP